MLEIIIFIFILLLGFMAREQLGKVKEIFKNFIIFVGAPILTIHSVLSQEKIEFGLVATVITVSLILNMVFSKMGNNIFRLKDKGCFLLLNSFGNNGFLGLPLSWIVFGSQGLYYGSLYALVSSLVYFTLGIVAALKEEKADWFSAIKDTIKFPVFWVNFFIFLILYLKITLPVGFMDVFGFIGKATLYLVMFYVGAFRFIISPLIIFLILFWSKIEGYQVLVFQAMMPPAIFSTIVASYYRMNEKLCANITTVLTIFFLATFILIELIGKVL